MTVPDRRVACRRDPECGEPLSRVRLRAGREMAVVNVSSSGVFVEGDVRLLPGVHVDVHVMTAAGRVLLRSRVVRAFVWRLTAEAGTYRGALAFPERVKVDSRGYPMPASGAMASTDSGSTYPREAA